MKYSLSDRQVTLKHISDLNLPSGKIPIEFYAARFHPRILYELTFFLKEILIVTTLLVNGIKVHVAVSNRFET